MKQKLPKLAGPKDRCGACNGAGHITCRKCGGVGSETNWKRQRGPCSGCGGTGMQACIVCKQMGVRGW